MLATRKTSTSPSTSRGSGTSASVAASSRVGLGEGEQTVDIGIVFGASNILGTATTSKPTIGIRSTSATATITSDPGILCFHHCNVKVFCFKLPHICPNCKVELDNMKEETNSTILLAATPKKVATTSIIATTKTASNLRTKNSTESSRRRMETLQAASPTSIGFRKTQVSASDSYSKAVDDKYYEDEDENDDDDDGAKNQDENEDEAVNPVEYNHTKTNDNGISLSKKLLPFRLPYPFVRASQYPCAIVLRPTTGDFLNDYNNSKDLHIAVTTSTGCIVEFDRHGLRRHRANNMPEWGQCLLVGDVPEAWYDYWDDILSKICNEQNRWSVASYHEDTHNCYTFVLMFLQALSYDKLSSAAHSKTTFCEKFIVPRTTTAGKYISLYRKLRDTGIYVHQQTNLNNNTKVRTLTTTNNSKNNNHRTKTTRPSFLSSSSTSASSTLSSLSGPSLAALYSSLTASAITMPSLKEHSQNATKSSSLTSSSSLLVASSAGSSQPQSSMSQNIIPARTYSTLCTIEE